MNIVTLTSDFGTADGYVGAMKGVILGRAPAARIVDIAHDVPRYDIAAGAYCLRQAAPYFPPGTIHVAVVDPGVGSARHAVTVDDGRCLYVGPDNGIFAMAVPEPVAAYAIGSPMFMRAQVSATFHGRDIFAAAAGALAAGARPYQAGPKVTLAPLPAGQSWSMATVAAEAEGAGAATGEVIEAAVIHVDRFGNLITNCPVALVAGGARARLGEHTIERLSRTFSDVAPGELLMYIGSADTLEIAVCERSATEVLGAGVGTRVRVWRNAP